MTKAENRAAAKAVREEQEQKRRDMQMQEVIAADLEQLRVLRHYLIFKSKSEISRRELISAIDDYVEKLTGDRTRLHGQNHSIG